MIQVIVNPDVREWKRYITRSLPDDGKVDRRVAEIISLVREEGDEALRALALKYDGAAPETLFVTEQEFAEAERSVSPELKDALSLAAGNIRRFHAAQLPEEITVETIPGVKCVQRSVPIPRVGLYVPGGTAPLFSTVLMLAIPASVAGCSRVVMCTPCGRDGKVPAATLYAAGLCGVREVYKAGGAQAIAAMAYGTPTIPAVDKIFGPGNRYVTKAKQIVATDRVAIDMPAGPSEVMVMADHSANPAFVAADLLSQAEHGTDSQSILLATSRGFAQQVSMEIDRQLGKLPRRQVAVQSLANSCIIVMDDREDMISFANRYAAEHLIISMEEPWEVARQITAAGSIFIGNYSPESAGDYASGTNHTLPTAGWARCYGGVSTSSFMRTMTLQELTPQGLSDLGRAVTVMAGAEGLEAHARAVTVRLENMER